jgi:DNA-binding HxlR family transcriptional regulator
MGLKKSTKIKHHAPYAIELIVDRWSCLIIREAFYGTRRFEQFYNSMGIARNILSSRLQHLVGFGIFKIKQYSRYPARYEYHLTDMGLDIYPMILSLMRFGDKWCTDEKGPPLTVRHNTCGQQLIPVAICSNCREDLKIREVTYEHKTKISGIRTIASRKRELHSRDLKNPGNACSVERALNLLGNRWTFLILREIFYGLSRFNQFHEELKISRSILASRLRELVQNGIIVKSKYADNPARFEYKITKKGFDIWPIAIASIRWGNRWQAGEDSSLQLLKHKTCGHVFDAIIVCSHCCCEVLPDEVTYQRNY